MSTSLAAQEVLHHPVELLRTLAWRPVPAAVEEAQLRIRQASVGPARPGDGDGAVVRAVDYEGRRGDLAETVREVGAQAVPPHLVLPEGPERPARVGLVQQPVGLLGQVVGHHPPVVDDAEEAQDRKSTRLNSSHANISYAVFCLKKKKVTSCRAL